MNRNETKRKYEKPSRRMGGLAIMMRRAAMTLLLFCVTALAAQAQGIGIDSYNLTLDDNWFGGASTVIPNISGGSNITLPSRSRIGYDFAGWTKNADGSGAVYEAGSNYTVTKNETLYGKWTVVDVTIGTLKYRVTSESPNTVEIVGYDGDGPTGSLAIPASITISGYDCAVTSIGYSAFSSCTGLTSVSIPSSVVSIGQSAFYRCTAMTTVSIGSGVATIDGSAFKLCTALTAFDVDGGNTAFKSEDGVLYSRDGTILQAYPVAKSGTAYDIPASVTNIAAWAFFMSTLSTVTFPYGLTTIGAGAFCGCDGLVSVTLPASVTDIGNSAFLNCGALASVNLYASSLTAYNDAVFSNNAAGRKIYVFSDCVDTYKSDNLWSAYFSAIEPITVTANDAGGSWGRWGTYYNGLADVTVADGTTIYKAAVNGAKTGVVLTETGSTIIKKGEAVLLKSTEASIALSSATDGGSSNYDDNELQGVDYRTAQEAGTNYYVLSKKASHGFGFYRLADGTDLGANKAYLAVSGSPSLARGYFGFGEDGTTGIRPPLTPPTQEGNGCAWYSLDGRRLVGKPSAKGVYIRNGRKEVIR